MQRAGVPIPLSAKEFALLETLMRHPGEVLSRYQLLEQAWDREYDNRSNIVDVYISYLREKIDRPNGTQTIETVRGVGYRIRPRRMLSRFSIRVRLTLLFAGVMTVVLLAIGGFVYERVATSLTASINKDLRVRADDVSGPKRDGAREDARDFGGAEGVAQLISADGRVLRGTPALETKPLLTPLEIQAARAGPIYLDRAAPLAFGDERWRLLAEPVTAAPGAEIAVVAASLKPREEALQHLLVQLLLAGAAALVLASIAGYSIAAAALRPVEEMSRRAAAISLSGGDTRLPVPPSGDEIAKLGMRLNEMLERLETAFAHERRFLADASHELQTPLAILRAELEIALRRPRSHEELEEVVRSAQEETNRLGRLAEDLLVVARADQGALPVHLTTIDADDLLDERRRALRAPGARERPVDHDRDEPRPRAPLRPDPHRAGARQPDRQLAALRRGHDHPRGAATGIRRRAARARRRRRLPRRVPARARSSASAGPTAPRSVTGSGLGLAIVQAIAQAHGGDATVANLEEGGSDVWLALPKSCRLTLSARALNRTLMCPFLRSSHGSIPPDDPTGVRCADRRDPGVAAASRCRAVPLLPRHAGVARRDG